jgi:HAD superfamily hydrolase (TIGR01509 family)
VARGVVFDLDGVLIDSEPVWLRVRRAVVAEFGGGWTDEADHRLLGMNTIEWARYLADDLGVQLPPERVAAVVIERMQAAYRRDVPVVDGGAGVVRTLHDDGFRLGLASSSPRPLIDAAVTALGLSDVFVATVSSDEVERGKPAPDVYLAAAERIGVPPQDCAAVEDSPNGIRSAVAAGMAVFAVPASPEGRAAAEDAGGDVRVVGGIRDVTPAAVREAGGQQ